MKDDKCIPLSRGLSKENPPTVKTVTNMANEKSAYAPMVGGVANGRGLTTSADSKKGAGRSKDLGRN